MGKFSGKSTAAKRDAVAATPVVDGSSAATVPADLLAQLEAARAENAALKAQVIRSRTQAMSHRPGEGGGFLIYGVNRLPINIYKNAIPTLKAGLAEAEAFFAKVEKDDPKGWRDKNESEADWRKRAIANKWFDAEDFAAYDAKKERYAKK